MSKCICIALTSDYLPGFKALINSINRHTKKFQEPIVCIDVNLSDDNRKFCRHLYKNITFLKPDMKNYVNLPKSVPSLIHSFYKLDVFKIAQAYDRVLFVDCDIIFVTSIDELLNIHPIADLTITYHKEYKLYNSGVMILSCLQPDIYNQIIKQLNKMQEAKLGDQTVIMTAMNKKILTVSQLDCRWNTTKRQIKRKTIENYSSIHFVGRKPWDGGEKGYEILENIWKLYS